MIMRNIDELKTIGGGSECDVFDTGNETVIKVFDNRDIGIKAYERNSIAAVHGLGPQVIGELFEVMPDNGEEVMIAYEVEKVVSGEMFIPHDSSWYPLKESESYRKLRVDLRALFGVARDMRVGNVGMTKAGVLVCIDFGDYSFDKDSCFI